MKKFIALYISLFTIAICFGQNYPIPVVPGKSFTVKPDKDTLWIITDNQLENALIAVKKLQNADAQIANYQKQISIYKKQLAVKDSIIQLTKNQLDLYTKNIKKCRDDLNFAVQFNKKQKTLTRIAIYGGIASSIISFLIGAYIFH